MKFKVRYYATEIQEDIVEAESLEEAESAVNDALETDYIVLGKPTDWMFGVSSVELVEDEDDE